MAADDLDPQIRSFAADMARAYGRYPDLNQLSLAEAREIAEQVRAPWRQGGPAMALTRDLYVPAPHGELRVRIHQPVVEPERPALLYLHGGGWTIFSIDTHDRIMREYAARAQVTVIGVDYALSPEAKYPLALEQVVAIARRIMAEPAQFGVRPKRLVIGGDSAGANLALATALKLRDAGEDVLAGLLLLYGVFDQPISDESAARYGGPDYMLTPQEMVQFWVNYLPETAAPDDVYARPLRARLEGLPGVCLLAGACDILAEQSVTLAGRLREVGVEVELRIYPGATHSFLEAVSVSALADRALCESAAWLSRQCGTGARAAAPVA